MDDSRFDTWTRRRFGLGLAAGGTAASLLWLTASDDVTAKKNKKKCKKSEKRCVKKCVKGTCCPGKTCQEDCQCTRTVEGTPFCKPNDQDLGLLCMFAPCVQCRGSAECEDGFTCIKDASFGAVALCQPPCGFTL